MKNRKLRRMLTLACCALALVTLSVGATVAYLTSTSEVNNTFTVGSVTITMDETDVDNSTEGKDRDTANSYHLLPGHEYTKDPIIHVASTSEDCYLFVKVSNDITAIEATGDTSVASQMAAKGWKTVEGQTNLYVYIGTAEGASAPLAVKANDNITVFEKIVVSDSVDNTTLASYAEKKIVINAYAVQKDGFESKTAAEIWNATFGASKN